MGCISSKPSGDEQPNNDVNNPDRDLVVATDASCKVDDALELKAEPQSPKEDDMLMTDTNTNDASDWQPSHKKLTSGRSNGFHTVEEYDELLQRIGRKKDDGELEGVSVIDINLNQPVIDIADKKDSYEEKGKTGDLRNIEFQTVPSLRQWLDSPRGDGGNADASTDCLTQKFAFGFYDDSITQTPGENLALVEANKQQKEESIIELVVAFDEYMQQLQMEEETILKTDPPQRMGMLALAKYHPLDTT